MEDKEGNPTLTGQQDARSSACACVCLRVFPRVKVDFHGQVWGKFCVCVCKLQAAHISEGMCMCGGQKGQRVDSHGWLWCVCVCVSVCVCVCRRSVEMRSPINLGHSR